MLQQIKYYVQTTLEVPERSYSNNNSSIHGSGQSCGSSRTEWIFISISLMKILESTTRGYLVSNPTGNVKWERKIIGVVDDKRIFIKMVSNEEQDTNIAMKYLQQASQYYEHFLYTGDFSGLGETLLVGL